MLSVWTTIAVRNSIRYTCRALQKAVYPWSAWTYTIADCGIPDKERPTAWRNERGDDATVWSEKDPDLAWRTLTKNRPITASCPISGAGLWGRFLVGLSESPFTSNGGRRKPMNGDTQIYVSGREYKVPGPLVTYEQIVKIWNKLHEAENKHIIGTPGIDYENDLKGEDGVLLPGKDVRVKDGTSFSVDPEHVS